METETVKMLAPDKYLDSLIAHVKRCQTCRPVEGDEHIVDCLCRTGRMRFGWWLQAEATWQQNFMDIGNAQVAFARIFGGAA